MNLVSHLRELRQLKGQAGYRYCLAWLVVLIDVVLRPRVVFLLTFWLVAQFDRAGSFATALTSFSPTVLRTLGKLF